jgi:starch phosphorylase
MFVFGLRAHEVANLKALGYDPRLYVEENRRLAMVLQAIGDGTFSRGDRERYQPLLQSLTGRDPYLLMADFASYLRAQGEVDALYRDRAAWAHKALLNVAGMGGFSSDRTVAEYVRKVWQG